MKQQTGDGNVGSIRFRNYQEWSSYSLMGGVQTLEIEVFEIVSDFNIRY